MTRQRIWQMALVVATLSLATAASAAFNFLGASYYTTNEGSTTITQHGQDGKINGSLTLSLGQDKSLKGLAFGHDNLLYAVVEQPANFSVVALDEAGSVLQTYVGAGNISTNLSYGKLAFDNAGSFYVATGSGVVRFQVGDPFSGQYIYTGGIYDVEVLPSGNLLIGTDYNVYEITNSGAVVREVVLTDPDDVAPGSYPSFTNIRGIEHDPATDSIYVTAIGSSSFSFPLMKL